MTSSPAAPAKTVAVIGGGPAGLMAAEVLAQAGCAVTVYEKMPSVGRKFLMAGRGGLNLTHSEDLAAFLPRYGPARERIAALVEAFPPQALVAWAEGLGQATFKGSSGRVFPKAMKASPLLRAWLGRLAELGVTVRTPRVRWPSGATTGWSRRRGRTLWSWPWAGPAGRGWGRTAAGSSC
jgi:predicted flavoprotein YhiN